MSKIAGKVFLVGAGPGAPDLVTLRGAQCLADADVVLHDDLSGRALLALAPAQAEKIYVGKRESLKTMEQEQICKLMGDRALEGLQVVRLKGGDPFVFGRGGVEARYLTRRGVPWELVPGITSAVAAAAFAGIPLTHKGLADGFEVLSGHGEEGLPGREAMTAVVMMGMRRLRENVELLRRRGYAGHLPAAVVRWGGLSRQQTAVGTLDTIAEDAAHLGSPAVLVVGQVVSLREDLSWFESRPLLGKRVLVTRDPRQARETCRLLNELGAEVIPMPTIAIQPPEDPTPLRQAARCLARYDYLILTSANGVEALWGALEACDLDSRALAGLTICAIGPGTARALACRGLQADLVPDDHRAEGILDLLPEEMIRAKKILLPRAAKAREILPETLRQRGAEVDLVQAYVSRIPSAEDVAEGLGRLRAGEVDVLTFTSASTVEHFAALVGPDTPALCKGKIVAAIGPITRDACIRHGLEVDLMPPQYTLPALMEALVDFFAPQQVPEKTQEK